MPVRANHWHVGPSHRLRLMPNIPILCDFFLLLNCLTIQSPKSAKSPQAKWACNVRKMDGETSRRPSSIADQKRYRPDTAKLRPSVRNVCGSVFA